MKAVRLTTCSNAFEARLVENNLENVGIPVMQSNVIMSLYPPMSGVDILVPENDYDKAMTVIKEQ